MLTLTLITLSFYHKPIDCERVLGLKIKRKSTKRSVDFHYVDKETFHESYCHISPEIKLAYTGIEMTKRVSRSVLVT